MTWMTWREHRAAATVGAVVVAAIAAAMLWLGVSARSKSATTASRPASVTEPSART